MGKRDAGAGKISYVWKDWRFHPGLESMTIILFIFVPLAFILLGKLCGLTVAASTFYSESGKRIGKTVSRWCMAVFPCIYVFLLVLGGEGNAGHGFTIFGSEAAFEILGGILYFAIPIMGAYVGVIYVIRDLTLGHESALKKTNERTAAS